MSKSKYIGRYEEYGNPDDTENRYLLDTINGNVYLEKRGVWELLISFGKVNLNDEKSNDHWQKYRKPKKED